VTRLKWSQLLKANPHIEALLGVDWPFDEVRQQPGGSSASPSAGGSALDSRVGSANSSPMASPLASHTASPAKAFRTLQPSPRATAAAAAAAAAAVSSPRRFTFSPSGTLARSVASSLAGVEQADAPLRTVTEAGWLEAFRRLARAAPPQGGLAAVQRLVDEFSRISRVAREEWSRQVERRAQELQEVARIQANLHAGHNRTGSFGALSRIHAQRRMLAAAVAAANGGSGSGTDEISFHEQAFAGGALSVDPAKAAQDSIVAFVPHLHARYTSQTAPAEDEESTASSRYAQQGWDEPSDDGGAGASGPSIFDSASATAAAEASYDAASTNSLRAPRAHSALLGLASHASHGHARMHSQPAQMIRWRARAALPVPGHITPP